MRDRGCRIDGSAAYAILDPPSSILGLRFTWLVALAAFLIAAPAARAWDEAIESVMYRSPDLPMARMVRVFPEGIKTPWLEALQRPEADYLCTAALTIGLAHRRGMKGLETAIPPLLEALDRPNLHPSVRLAVAQTLIELDARNAAAALFRLAESGDRDLRNEIEPVLARWDYAPAREIWLERLRAAARSGEPSRAPPEEVAKSTTRLVGPTSSDSLLLAILALGAVHEERAIPELLPLVLSRRVAAPARLVAARALGLLRTSGSEPDARGLATDGSRHGIVARLAAASLLRHHQGDEAVRLLQGLALDAEPAVTVVALDRLVEIDPKLVVPALAHLIASSDAKVRSSAVEVLLRAPSVEHIRLLADRLNDPHPEVRVKARKSLHELAGKPEAQARALAGASRSRAEFREPVIRQASRMLAGSDWRGQEQASILLGQLEHKPSAGRMVELLKAERTEVMVAAAWGVRRLGVAETLPAALEHFRLVGVRAPAVNIPGLLVPAISGRDFGAIDQQLSQLAQFFGESRYRPADAVLRLQIPRAGGSTAPVETRAAAIWALGLIHEGHPVSEIDRVLVERLNDTGGPFRPPEHTHVRWMCAVTMGRMNAKETLATLRRFYFFKKPSLDPVNNACGWAIEKLTGETMPPAGTVEVPAETFKNWLQILEPPP